MAGPIDVIAILTPVPGKADRLVELLNEVANWIKDNEPGTLKYEVLREINKGDKDKVIIVERYADSSAVKAHGSSDKFKAFQKQVAGEKLLGGPMDLKVVKPAGGLSRL